MIIMKMKSLTTKRLTTNYLRYYLALKRFRQIWMRIESIGRHQKRDVNFTT
jgi:hypothetical protein